MDGDEQMKRNRSGWHGESRRHSLARKGIKTARGTFLSKEDANELLSDFKDVLSFKSIRALGIVEQVGYSIANNPYVEMRKAFSGNYKTVQTKRYEDTKNDILWDEDDDTVENGVDDYVYHTTDLKNLEGISNHGLLTNLEKMWEDSGDRSYFSDYPSNSVLWYGRYLELSNKLDEYNESINDRDKFIVLRVPYQNYEFDEEVVGITEYGSSFSTE